jgi:DNA mismatch endonuclease (patch repair protein)
MSRIRAANTKPEMVIRKGLHSLGFRYRLHVKELPGRPDLYFPKYDAVIQVHGCFWHKHDCQYFKWPSTRPDFWREKIEGTVIRDTRNQYEVKERGLRQLTIWECALRGQSSAEIAEVIADIADWLVSDRKTLVLP